MNYNSIHVFLLTIVPILAAHVVLDLAEST